MRRSGGAAILMLQNIKVLLGDIDKTLEAKPMGIFALPVIGFFDHISGKILRDHTLRGFKDLASIAFFLRKSSLEQEKGRHSCPYRMGVGTVFHIAPSNIPVQFFYSLAVSLLAGNANIIRVSRKGSEQETILCGLMEDALGEFPEIRDYVCLVRYGHEQEITDYLSGNCDARVIWGGDASVGQIRKSPLSARAFDVTFADRFSLCVIDADQYLAQGKKAADKIAKDFYMDTYFTDQNACNSTRLVIWIGDCEGCRRASAQFWECLHGIVGREYQLNGISAVDKLVGASVFAIEKDGVYDYSCSYGNYINVVSLAGLAGDLSKYKGNSGFFLQCFLGSLDQIAGCIQKDWQTVTYFGVEPLEIFQLLLRHGRKGIDRIVPIGKSGTPSLKWDGIDFIERLSRDIDVLQ